MSKSGALDLASGVGRKLEKKEVLSTVQRSQELFKPSVLDETEGMSPLDSESATTLTDVEDSSFPLFHSGQSRFICPFFWHL
uniref:Uncharacterized protein n=1 Tax=Fagus sylvatica TaxID=28930 RepID=A0A2N9ESP2_FAGSY